MSAKGLHWDLFAFYKSALPHAKAVHDDAHAFCCAMDDVEKAAARSLADVVEPWLPSVPTTPSEVATLAALTATLDGCGAARVERTATGRVRVVANYSSGARVIEEVINL